MRVREAAWREALAAVGLAPGPLVHVTGDPREEAIALLSQDPTAIVCASDAPAIEAIAAARELGLVVPDDVSVTGFDDSALAAFATALTSVRVDYAEFGEAAASALIASIAGEPAPAYRASPPELVVRASTGIVPAR